MMDSLFMLCYHINGFTPEYVENLTMKERIGYIERLKKQHEKEAEEIERARRRA